MKMAKGRVLSSEFKMTRWETPRQQWRGRNFVNHNLSCGHTDLYYVVRFPTLVKKIVLCCFFPFLYSMSASPRFSLFSITRHFFLTLSSSVNSSPSSFTFFLPNYPFSFVIKFFFAIP